MTIKEQEASLTNYPELSIFTKVSKWVAFGQIWVVAGTQVLVFIAMVVGMQFEWIISLFLSVLYLMFPTVSALFLLNKGLQMNLMSTDNNWAIWFGLIF